MEMALSVASVADEIPSIVLRLPPARACSVVLLMAMIPWEGCLPVRNQAISESGSLLSRTKVADGKLVPAILAASGHAAEAMKAEPFMGCPGSPRLISFPGTTAVIL